MIFFNSFVVLKMEVKRFVTILLTLFMLISAQAQLLNEIGVALGGSNYSGDIGNEWYINPNNLAGGFVYRRNLNTRLSVRATLNQYQLSDADSLAENEARKERDFSFKNDLTEVALGVEVNFLDYDISRSDISYTPYMFVELAGYRSKKAKSVSNDGTINYSPFVSLALPMGVGFKTRVTRQIGVSLELRVRYALTDHLDYTTPDIPELDMGNPQTNDWYFFTGVLLTYSFQRPPCAVKPRY